MCIGYNTSFKFRTLQNRNLLKVLLWIQMHVQFICRHKHLPKLCSLQKDKCVLIALNINCILFMYENWFWVNYRIYVYVQLIFYNLDFHSTWKFYKAFQLVRLIDVKVFRIGISENNSESIIFATTFTNPFIKK